MNYIDDLAELIRTSVPAGDLPNEDTHMLFRMYAILLLAKGEGVEPADVHNAWVAWMSDRQPGHESLVPYEALPAAAAAQDRPYVDAIRRVSRGGSSA